ncbi:Non-specific serine/threonine protein kinase, partial [Bertholletia excelsa]
QLSLSPTFLPPLSQLASPSTTPPNTTGHTCSANTSFPCRTYAFYRAASPNFLDLASIGDLFGVSRLAIAEPSNISSPTSPLLPGQSLFVPLTCSCNSVNRTTNFSYAGLNYTIKAGNTFYIVSSDNFENLTTYQSVEIVNPDLVPTNLTIGVNVVFPIFCKCPDATQLLNGVNYLISYVFQPSDNFSSIAARFGSDAQSIRAINGDNIELFQTVFIPVSKLPVLSQPISSQPNVTTTPSEKKDKYKGAVVGLAIGLGICAILVVLIGGLWIYREKSWKKKLMEEGEQRGEAGNKGRNNKGMLMKEAKVNLMADVSDCLDKYRVYEIEDLREATDGFDQKWLIQGSVYKGCMDGVFYAIKKMKWDAYEELRILQKVNHGNLVKLEGFCIDPEDANCYLVYEYVENGSLYSWLHENRTEKKLSWKTRLRIAVDVANGLQYVHEHTRPRVVHKDIKSSNILLDSNMRAKIANFGLAKSGCNAITMHIVGTQGYLAPEYISDGVVSTRMDVFAFGVVLLELVSGRKAIDEEGRLLWMSVRGIMEESNEERKERKVREWMDRGLVEESCSMESVMNVMAVALACVNKDPSKRCSMVDIVYALSKSDDLLFDISEDGLSPRPITAR